VEAHVHGTNVAAQLAGQLGHAFLLQLGGALQQGSLALRVQQEQFGLQLQRRVRREDRLEAVGDALRARPSVRAIR
jgi:hypothetical protein